MDEPPTVALLPWGHVIEDYLEPQGLTLDRFAAEFTGSWMFAWVNAFARAGVRVVLVCVSVEQRTRELVHRPTGARIVVVPTTRAYRRTRRGMSNPYGRTAEDTFGRRARGWRRLPLSAVREVAPYLSTPLLGLGRVFEREGVDAILCQEYEFPRFDVCALLGRVLGVPVLASYQGGDYQRWLLERPLRPLSLRAATRLLVAPQREVDRLRTHYRLPLDRIARVVNPVDLDVWQPRDRADARAALGLPAAGTVVAWHGRVSIWQKGLDVLLDAWPSVAASDDRAHLLLIGGGPDSDALDRMIAAQPLPRVWRVRTHVDDQAALSRHLAAADLYVFPSRHEGFPVAPIEAMACGLPLVATDVSGVREILGEEDACGGILVQREDADGLAAAIRRLVSDAALRERLGVAARRSAEERFSLDAVGSELYRLVQPFERASARTMSRANAAVEPRAG